MQIRERLPARHDEIDEAFECLLFLGAAEGPLATVGDLAVIVFEQIAEQIFLTRLPDERITFEVEKNVSLGRCRQAG